MLLGVTMYKHLPQNPFAVHRSVVDIECWVTRGGKYVGPRIAAKHCSLESLIALLASTGNLPNSKVSGDVRANKLSAVRHTF